MSSVTGNKDRLAGTARSRKYGVNEVCSPTKSSAPFSPESWYRKAYEESRAGSRPAPEGAGSIPGSSGTPSPGSGTSSPGSFSGSPGPASPGIGNSSPGSLGGSPGFGTGSPGSGSGGGSSPGSDRGVWCENCNARLVELKRQALKLLLPGPHSSKDPSITTVIHDKLQVPNTIRKSWNERDNRCDICATHLNQLKQEAIQMVTSLENSPSVDHYDASPGSPPGHSNIPAFVGPRQMGSLQPRDWVYMPNPYTTSSYPGFVASKHAGKPNSLGLANGQDKKNVSPSHQAKVSLQMATSPSNGNILNSVAIQAHQYLDGSWSLSRTNGVTLYPYQISQLMTETGREGLTEAALNRYNADKPSIYNFPASQSTYVATETSTSTSVAASFFARAAQKLNLSSKKKKQRTTPSLVSETPLFSTSFCGILQTCPPPAPPCLLRAVNKVKDNPGLGKVKVMVRICSTLVGESADSSSFLKADPRKKQITLYDPLSCNGQNAFQKRGSQIPPKMFAFDAVFPQDASQAEVCAGTVAEVIQSVVNGADGCVFCFGHSKLGKSYTMIGKDDSMQNLGIIPCAISWLFKLINERKEKTGARFSVRVSAVEVWGKEENLRDLLSEVATGSLQDGQSPGVYLCEDPICGMQLQNQSELRAPTAEKAAFFLDAAIASRRSSQRDCDEDDHRNSHMLFTLHIYQYRMEKSGKGGMSGGRSRLHLIDLGSCVKVLSKSRDGSTGQCLSLSALGNVILALVNGSKHIPYKESKLTMLLRESLGNMNCRTTMIAHISAAAGNYTETLSTIQIASRVLRMKKKKTKYTSSSSGGESSCEEGRMRRPTQLRPFHSRNVVDPDFPLLSLSSDPDYSSSSEQSCDTVIYVGPNGTALSDKELTDNEGPPDFVPIVPVLQKTKNEAKCEEISESAPNKSERDCLKCNTFAELQERLDCIDGSEETNRFPFEELPVTCSGDHTTKGSELAQVTEPKNTAETKIEENIPENQSSDKDSRECLGGTAHKMQKNHAAAPSGHINDNSTPSSPRSVTGSCGAQSSHSQLCHNNSLQGSRESLNSLGFVEGKPRAMGSPRLGIASLSKTSEYKPPSSPSQRCKVYTQKGVIPNTSPSMNIKDSLSQIADSLPQPEIRTPPVGMSPQVMKRSISTASSFSADAILLDQQTDNSKALKKEVLSTTMVTVQQPLELNGEDELVFTLVEELTISGVLDNGRPTSIISFNSDCSVQALASGSRPVSIISSISEDLESYSNSAPVSDISITQFLPLPKTAVDEKCQEVCSRRSSISSWLSEMSTGSDGEQSCHSFIAQACYGHGEAMADPPISEFTTALQNISVMCTSNRQNSGTDNIQAHPELAEDCKINVSPLKGCKISTVGKTTVTISKSSSLSVCESCIPMKTNITVYPCIAVSPFKSQEYNEDLSGVNHSNKPPQHQENNDANCKVEPTYDDPWLKREDDVKRDSTRSSDRQIADAISSITNHEQDKKQKKADRLSSSSGEGSISPVPDNINRIVDGCEMALITQSTVHLNDHFERGSLPRMLEKSGKLEAEDIISNDVDNNTGSSVTMQQFSRSTLERRVASPKHCVLPRPKGTPPLPPIRKSSLDQKNRASPQHHGGSPSKHSLSSLPSLPDELKLTGLSTDTKSNSSSKLFSAKLEQLASRTNSLGRSNGSHYECLSLERAGSLSSVSSRMVFSKDSTLPRSGRSLNRSTMSSPINSSLSQSAGASPKSSPCKISAVSKLLLANPKARSLSASTTKTLSFSTKSLPQSVGRSSSLPPNGKNISWSTQSLSRSKGSGLASKLPLRAVNGRISELLQGTAGSRGVHSHGNMDSDERGTLNEEDRPVVHTLPSPYSKITPPRKPHRCSSGHGSDNSSVLSGELPPAMGKTALFYHSGGSSGYESMMRDSEATGSGSSAQDSMSENSSSVSGRCRSLKTSKKRSNAGSQRRKLVPALSLDATSPVRKPTNSPGVRWVDGPMCNGQRGLGEPFEIKVYEIDDVERLHRHRSEDCKEVSRFNSKIKILEHRQQRIAEVRAKYEWLLKELEITKQFLMLDPNKWLSEFDLEQTYEVDSIEYLEALECVTERLENRVNFCKAHLMMITCFDITSRRR
ncbi:kinesin-like protein KIF26B [Xenopus laevis]|uniref:Kinesin-like protein KIF26B n=2 Tax=Xenopus laevis TaxID=8355 RepID=A0A8J1KN10_XENLA|nr:kinesin-like protein KIF26B [Xenopus laevis]